MAHTEEEARELFDRFSDAARQFGLTVSLKKMEVMLQSASHQHYTTLGLDRYRYRPILAKVSVGISIGRYLF